MRRSDDGIMEFDLNDAEDWRSAYAELLETPIGQEYVSISDPETHDADAKAILRAVVTLNGRTVESDHHTTLGQLTQALEKLMIRWRILRTAEETKPLPVPAAPVVEAPKLSGSQQAWRDFRIWSESHSSSECKARARSGDQAYADFYRLNLTRELAEQSVGDAVQAAGTPTSKTAPTAELRGFARAYLVEKSENLRPKNGLIVLAGRQISYTYFNTLVEQASAAGLL